MISFYEKLRSLVQSFKKVQIYFLPSTADYWDTITICSVDSKPKSIGRYYLNFESKAYYPGPFDENGIPLFALGKNILYHPTVVSQYALGLFELLYEGNYRNNEIKNKFLNQTNWLVSNYIEEKGGALWKLNFPVDQYNINPPWISSLVQGEAISVLCRAFELTGNNKYLIIAEKALVPFSFEVKDGGVLNYYNGELIFEEYPSENTNFVLNGFIFSLFGLLDLSISNNKNAEQLFLKGIHSLERNLKYFDAKFWSKYNLFSSPQIYLASYSYHRIHIEQLKALYNITHINLFKEYSVKWEKYEVNIFNKTKALLFKIYSKLFFYF